MRRQDSADERKGTQASPPAKRKWVIWSAVSSLPQAKEISLSEQLRKAREVVAQHGGVVVDELEVPGESRSIVLFEDACKRIPAYARLRDLLAQRSFDVLVYLDRSRLGRTAALVMTIAALCEEAGVALYEMDAPPASIGGKRSYADDLVGAIRAVGAQQEVEKFRDRSAMGRIGRTKKGLLPGRAPYGYVKTFDPDTGEARVEEDPQTGPIVREIFRRYLAGDGTHRIAAWLNEAGIPAPGAKVLGVDQWNHNSVRKVIRRRWVYAGFVEFDSSIANQSLREPGRHPALISEAQAVKAENEEKYRAGNRRQSRASLLSGLCICGECGRTMTVVIHSTRDGGKLRYVGYRCMPSMSPEPHERRQASARVILPALRRALEWMHDDADIEAMLADEADEDYSAREAAVSGAEAELKALKERLFKADALLLAGTLDAERHAEAVKRIGRDIASAKERLSLAQQELARVRHRGNRRERLEEVRRIGVAVLDQDDIPRANAWLREHVRMVVHHGEVARIYFI